MAGTRNSIMLQITTTDQIEKHFFWEIVEDFGGFAILTGYTQNHSLARQMYGTDMEADKKHARAALKKNRKRAQVDMRHLFGKKVGIGARDFLEEPREMNIFDDSGFEAAACSLGLCSRLVMS